MARIEVLKKEHLKKVIDDLKSVDLKSADQSQIIAYFNNFGNILFQSVLLEPGTMIFRSRPAGYGKYYEKIENISYPLKPPKLGRGSNEKTMFYGSLSTENVNLGRTVSFVEVSKIWLKEDPQFEKESITCGRWLVKKPFRLAAIVHHEKFHDVNPETQELYHKFEQIVEEMPEIKDELMLLLNFFAEEFSKKVKAKWEYKISAAVTETAIQAGLGGVLYPSFQTEYQGFNVALSQEIVDNCLELEMVLGCDVFRKDKEIIVDNCLQASEFLDGKIAYKEIPYKDKIGNAILNQYKENN